MLERRIEQEIRDFLKSDRKEALMVTGAYVKIGLNQEKPYKTRV